MMLTRLFSEDSSFYRFMSKLFDLILLNFLWLLTSLLISLRYFGYTFQMIGVILMPLGLFLMIGLMTGTGLSWVICFYVLVGISSTAYFLIKGPWRLLIKKLEIGSETEKKV